MPTNLGGVKFEDMDVFHLLRLDHLTDQEKSEYGVRLLNLAFQSVAANDLPKYLSAEEMGQFNALAEKEETRQKAFDLLTAKIPNYDDVVKHRLLMVKKDLVRANIEERLDINKQEREELRSNQDETSVAERVLKNEQERTNLEKTLAAIDLDDWDNVSSLIS